MLLYQLAFDLAFFALNKWLLHMLLQWIFPLNVHLQGLISILILFSIYSYIVNFIQLVQGLRLVHSLIPAFSSITSLRATFL